jgi:hypothetical protein
MDNESTYRIFDPISRTIDRSSWVTVDDYPSVTDLKNPRSQTVRFIPVLGTRMVERADGGIQFNLLALSENHFPPQFLSATNDRFMRLHSCRESEIVGEARDTSKSEPPE